MEPIPTDLIIEIFSRLPAKSIGRFRCLSKQWCLILQSPDFTELFRSCARPRLLFAVEREGSWSFFSSPQSSSSSLVLTADFHCGISKVESRFTCSYTSGLFYFSDLRIPNVDMSLVFNPITGQYVRLPYVEMLRKSRGFLGFDPIEKVFKVLVETYPFCSDRDHHEVLTLGTGELTWRKKKIDCPPYFRSLCEGICINGVLYYLVCSVFDLPNDVVCFDLRSEQFKLVVADCFDDPKTTKLVNYKGKLGGINFDYGKSDGMDTLELCLWVLEDVERQEWVNYVYTLPETKLIDNPFNVSVGGVTATGEIVLAMNYTYKPYYVFYFNPERNTLQSVEIQGFGADLEVGMYRGKVRAFVDHVEDLSVDDSVQLKSSISANPVKCLSSNCEE
ncbi:hypothetical protein AALP_AA5G165700 [Arabis alpina]|uniref:F-box domain-containing protein n=1 Tax=Arabis alpina TaxID=50452 RepID=A0A087GXI9_ARAAL|nr:hypothetical protein AALP_AA5G165700 [Arabis alpina]